MGNRLTKIYTRTGDDGTTGLADGSRLPKDSARIEALGAVDELNSALGVLLAEALPLDVSEPLTAIQHRLFDLGGEIALPGHRAIRDEHLSQLEALLDRFNATLSPLKEFILPGGSRPASLCHTARAVARRAERSVVVLVREENLAPTCVHYLNRLSDLLFVLCRVLNRQAGLSDVYWQKG
jgi:cob(I)alamin adenosyltransferase